MENIEQLVIDFIEQVEHFQAENSTQPVDVIKMNAAELKSKGIQLQDFLIQEHGRTIQGVLDAQLTVTKCRQEKEKVNILKNRMSAAMKTLTSIAHNLTSTTELGEGYAPEYHI